MSLLKSFTTTLFGRPDAERLPKLPDGQMRIHLLAGDFRDEAAARSYCYDVSKDEPEHLTRDQPQALIITNHVEVDFGDHVARLYEIFEDDEARALLEEIDGQNTLIIIAEPAFGDLPYRLENTDILDYLGARIVAV